MKYLLIYQIEKEHLLNRGINSLVSKIICKQQYNEDYFIYTSFAEIYFHKDISRVNKY